MLFNGMQVANILKKVFKCYVMKAYDSIEWFDALVFIKLNPDHIDMQHLSEEDLDLICQQIEHKAAGLWSEIQQRVFICHKSKQARLVVQNYHDSLISILDIALRRQEEQQNNTSVMEILTEIINSLNFTIKSIKNRFGRFLKSSIKVSLSDFQSSKQQLKNNLDILKVEVSKESVESKLSILLIHHFERYSGKKSFATLHQINYNKKLIKKLIGTTDAGVINSKQIISLLIEMNFNTKPFIAYLTGFIYERVAMIPDDVGKLEELHLQLLEINHKNVLHRKFNRRDPGILHMLKRWIHDEIDFQKSRLDLQQKFSNEKGPELPLPKLVCNLSSDQISIFLRALDEAKIVHAKSLNEVFKVIVPFLATPNRNDLSPGSVRSKSYTIEERDKDVLLEALEKVIVKIRRY